MEWIIAATSLGNLLGHLAFWRGVGRLILDVILIGGMLYIVSASLGHPISLPRIWPFGKQQAESPRRPAGEAAHDGDSGEAATAERTPGSAKRRSTEAHLEFVNHLRKVFQYQASTVVLIVFAVLILGIQHVLGATEIATILSGIAGDGRASCRERV